MRCRPAPFLLGALVCASPLPATAVVTFEGALRAGVAMNVRPADPYAEAGLTFLPAIGESAIISTSNADVRMLGNDSDWLIMSPANQITLRPSFGTGTFRLSSLRLGPTSIGTGSAVSVSIVGHRADGSTLSQTFASIATATTVDLGWSGLKGIEFSADDVLGLDDIEATTDPITPLPPGHAVLRFEDVAPRGRTNNPDDQILSVDPETPYRESGYRIVTSVARNGGVVDSTGIFNLVGEATDWMGFSEVNSLTLTREENGGVFDLDAFVAGPLQYDFSLFLPPDVTLTGTLSDGSTLTETFAALETATRLTVDWKGLTSVLVTSTQSVGIDNVEVSAIPEPSVWMSLAGGLGFVSLAVLRNGRRRTGCNAACE